MQVWLARFAAAAVPILVDAAIKLFNRLADRLETKSAVKAAKAARTADQLREASKRLTDATNRTHS
jgi:hypothetical protein